MKKEKNNIKKGKGRDKMAESEEVLKEDIPVNDNADAADAKDDVAVLADKVAELEGIIATMKEDELRRAADTENYKRRLRLDKENAVKYANEQLISDLLTPIDNFARAIEAADKSQDFESMKTGVIMVQDQLLSVLRERWGLEAIDAKDKDFDPNEMEAYSVIEDENLKTEKVVQEFIKGWKLNGKVLRTAKVLVGKPKEN
jgi:molecular chaperone GrpE